MDDLIPVVVFFPLLLFVMDATIQFNDKPGTIAIKISHIIKTFLAGYIISTLSTNLASAPPLPILGRGRGGYNFDSNGRGGYTSIAMAGVGTTSIAMAGVGTLRYCLYF